MLNNKLKIQQEARKILLQKEAKLRFKEWVNQAKRDLDLAKLTLRSDAFEWSTFACQQVLEKLFKGIYLLQKIEYPPHSHDLIKLIEFIPPKPCIENQQQYLKDLTKCYIASRYPEERIGNPKFDKLLTKKNAIILFKFTQKIIKWYTQKFNFKM